MRSQNEEPEREIWSLDPRYCGTLSWIAGRGIFKAAAAIDSTRLLLLVVFYYGFHTLQEQVADALRDDAR